MRMMKYEMALARVTRTATVDGFLDLPMVEEHGVVVEDRAPTPDGWFGVVVGLLAGFACLAFASGAIEDATSMEGPTFVLAAPAAGATVPGTVEVRGHEAAGRRLRASVVVGGRVVGAAEAAADASGAVAMSIPAAGGPFPVDAELVVSTAHEPRTELARVAIVVAPADAAGLLDLSSSRPGLVEVEVYGPVASEVTVRLLNTDGSTIAQAEATPSGVDGWAGLLLPGRRFRAVLTSSLATGTQVVVEVAWVEPDGSARWLRRLVVVPEGP